MSIKRNIIVWDTETSGLDPEDGCEIVQIAAKAISQATLDDHASGIFHCYIKPQRPDKAQDGALKVIGEGWAKAQNEGLNPKVAYKAFMDWIDSVNDSKGFAGKPVMIAYNSRFDENFLDASMKEYKLLKKGQFGYETPWSFRFDAMGWAYALFESDPEIMNIKLDTVLAKLNLERENSSVHSAVEDVELLTEWVRRWIKFQRVCNSRIRRS